MTPREALAEAAAQVESSETAALARQGVAAFDAMLAACDAAAMFVGKVPSIPNHEGEATSIVRTCWDAIRKAKGQA